MIVPGARQVEFQEGQAEEALLEGDVPYVPGSARAALSHRDFTIVWAGLSASNIGTWMQNFTLAAYGWELTHSAGYVGLLGFAQLGPILLLSMIGGALADAFDRRRIIVTMQLGQLAGSLLLALLATASHPSTAAIFFCVLAIGVFNALNAPAQVAIIPNLVPREDLQGAISLQSMQMNASRVVGPALAGVIYPGLGPAAVFAVNAVTYLFAVAGVVWADFPTHVVGAAVEHEPALQRMASGFRIAWADPLVRRILVTMTLFSFFSLSFIYLMPTLASENLGMNTRSLAYGLLFAGFALGAALGALSIGTVLVKRSKPVIVRVGLASFAVLLAVFALARTPALAYPVVFAVGLCYFAVVTSLSTVLQAHLSDDIRGRVMAIWMMAFGGTVPVGVLVAGQVAEATSITAVVLAGAIVALLLAAYADLRAVAAPAE
ncbi:MAG: MFS transporter [Acidimicrobiia bacterium]|nr:MFS transporter [Acidimicrobiia bacterium]